MRRPFLLPLVLALFALSSCHHASTASTAVTCTTSTSTSSSSTSTSTCTDPTTNISVTISPATASVSVATTLQFQDSVQGGTNSVTNWQVNGTTGGSDTTGRIDSNGLYHAPTQIPSPATVTVGAVAFEDQKVAATSTVTITPAPTVQISSPAPCTSSVSPPLAPVCVTNATSGSANTVTFTATETGGSTNIILWYVGPVGGLGVLGGNATLGTINASGVYSPPRTPPIGQLVVVTAAAEDSTNSTASLSVKISGYSTSSLQGQFAFSMQGSNASGRFFRAGSFVADGAGNLNSILEDVNSASGASPAPISSSGGYTVSADGRGTLQFNDGLTPATFNFVLVNGTQLQIIGFDATGTATGQADAQNIPAFDDSALNGTYAFDFSGAHGSNGISEIGEFMADGTGHITGGLIDVNDNGAPSPSPLQITGNTAALGQPPSYASTYTPPVAPNGRGTLTLATSGSTMHFSFYVVSRGSAKFLGTDSETAIGAFAGVTMQQAPNVTFDQTSLNGPYAFLLNGSGSGGTYASAGSFSADGLGHIGSAVLDENLSGAPTANLVLSGVSYSVTSNGLGTLIFGGGRTYVFYFGATGTAFFQETDSVHPNLARDGTFALQQNASFALSQIAGTYAFSTSGPSSGSAEVITGDLATDGLGGVSAGTLDINTAGTTLSDVPITPAANSFSTSSSAERGTLSLNLGSPANQTRNFGVYVVSPTQVFILEIDSGHPGAGALLKQF